MKNRIAGLLMETGTAYNKYRLHGKAYFSELLPGGEGALLDRSLAQKKRKICARFARWILPSVLHTTAHFSATRSQYRQAAAETEINSALAYCEKQIENPTKTYLVLITDLYYTSEEMPIRCLRVPPRSSNAA
jgi:hypothetical protein